MKKYYLLYSFIFTFFSFQLFAMNEHTKTLDSTCNKTIEMVSRSYKKEEKQKKMHAQLKFNYDTMMQLKVTNNVIKQEHADCINKECSQYNLYSYLMPIDNDENSKFHHLVYARDARVDRFKPHCPFIFAYFPNKYGCTANSIIATNKNGLCFNLHEKYSH